MKFKKNQRQTYKKKRWNRKSIVNTISVSEEDTVKGVTEKIQRRNLYWNERHVKSTDWKDVMYF